MNNIDRAAQVIGTWIREHTLNADTAHYLARALADAGLLAPELPDESWPQVWELNDFLVTAIEDGGETIGLAENEGNGNEGLGWFMDKHLARKLALALLSAAQHAKKPA